MSNKVWRGAKESLFCDVLKNGEVKNCYISMEEIIGKGWKTEFQQVCLKLHTVKPILPLPSQPKEKRDLAGHWEELSTLGLLDPLGGKLDLDQYLCMNRR